MIEGAASWVGNILLVVAVICIIANQVWLSSFTTALEPIPISLVKQNVTLLLMVTTYAGDYTRRSIMRETYLSFTDRYPFHNLHVYFHPRSLIPSFLLSTQPVHVDVHCWKRKCNKGAARRTINSQGHLFVGLP